MAFKPYWEKLKDPRWQRKRLEIMQRDDFTCTRCNTATETLNVHHVRYIKGREPWEYENDLLKTLCESCHKETHEFKEKFDSVAAALFSCAEDETVERAIGYMFGLLAYEYESDLSVELGEYGIYGFFNMVKIPSEWAAFDYIAQGGKVSLAEFHRLVREDRERDSAK
jgi:hypothetical protein